MTDCRFPYGEPSCRGVLKETAEDFQVTEELGFDPDGTGEHLYVYVEKTGLTTTDLIDLISKHTGISTQQISYSGLKDKQAVTRQWLSLHLPGRDFDLVAPKDAGFRIIDQQRHSKKLRIGTHRYNRFRVVLKELEGWSQKSQDQLAMLEEQGMANYFGTQRFGRNQDNVQQALSQLGRRKLGRQKRSIFISALRSAFFNRVLSKRIATGVWMEPLPGDCFMLRGSRSYFKSNIDDEITERFRGLDISSCGSLYGTGNNPLNDQALSVEQSVEADCLHIIEVLGRQKVERQMRAHRVVAEDLEYEYNVQQRSLVLSCRLPAGSYLTSLLDHLVLTNQSF